MHARMQNVVQGHWRIQGIGLASWLLGPTFSSAGYIMVFP